MIKKYFRCIFRCFQEKSEKLEVQAKVTTEIEFKPKEIDFSFGPVNSDLENLTSQSPVKLEKKKLVDSQEDSSSFN
jgi:hypothetical protein